METLRLDRAAGAARVAPLGPFGIRARVFVPCSSMRVACLCTCTAFSLREPASLTP